LSCGRARHVTVQGDARVQVVETHRNGLASLPQ
jgi:hypothetical protein